MTGPTGIQTGQTFDNNFRVLTRTEAKQDPAISATTSYIYDNNGNPTTVTDPRGKFTTNIYDQRNRKSDSTGPAPFYQTTHWQYHEASNVLLLTQPDITTEQNTYDPMNRVLTHKEGDSAHLTRPLPIIIPVRWKR